MDNPILEINDLSVHFSTPEGIAKAVDRINFQLYAGECLALVGESGSGKSVSALSILRLMQEARYPTGEILFRDPTNGYALPVDLLQTPDANLRKIRGNQIGLIFQEPMTSLNPLHKVGKQIMEVLRLHKKMSLAEAKEQTVELLEQTGIPAPILRFNQFPHELSGGMKQRAMIAMALACRPALIIADEPTTALDVTIQAQILRLIKEQQKANNAALMLITHDLGVVENMADRIAVMYAGKIVEIGNCQEIFRKPTHPYTFKLFESIPQKKDRNCSLNTIPGQVPSVMHYRDQGCRFLERCEYREDQCNNHDMRLTALGNQFSACILGAKFEPIAEPITSKKNGARFKETAWPILETKELKSWFPLSGGLFKRVKSYVKAVDGVDFQLYPGQTMGVVGESGCGKTTLAETLLQLIKVRHDGSAVFQGESMLEKNRHEFRPFRKEIQIVFQDPFSSLNPNFSVGEIVREGLDIHYKQLSEKERNNKMFQALKQVGLENEMVLRFPHEFSGGQRQRIAIARALVVEPKILILDEPTSALDMSVQAQILMLLKNIQQKTGISYIFISHNLSVIHYLCDSLLVMYLGKVIEKGTVQDIFEHPLHPYTKSLLTACLDKDFLPDPEEPERWLAYGDVPSPLNPPEGCHFAQRCPLFKALQNKGETEKIARCQVMYPQTLTEENTKHEVACHWFTLPFPD